MITCAGRIGYQVRLHITVRAAGRESELYDHRGEQCADIYLIHLKPSRRLNVLVLSVRLAYSPDALLGAVIPLNSKDNRFIPLSSKNMQFHIYSGTLPNPAERQTHEQGKAWGETARVWRLTRV